ncbi:MAG: orotidine-5'-phosphate decarboxylase [Planctomycetes bacterium]|nr:orotidine-5'-phosphate decarboxylase [Planctomycetota bacterium]
MTTTVNRKANFSDKLINIIQKKNSCVVVGLDPYFDLIPDTIKQNFLKLHDNVFKYAANVILEFNKEIIDSLEHLIGIVKLQIAFYELYGWQGIWAYTETIHYAKQKGLIVIGDVKRGDVPSTATAYANAHIGKVLINNYSATAFQSDAITVNPLLGTDSMLPFIKNAETYDKGIFILTKTSNPSSVEFQDILCGSKKLHRIIAEKIHEWGSQLIGTHGYSSIGAVVGATYPEDISALRKIMPNAYLLIPGYGTQGATAEDLKNCFNPDGYGAIINASRSVLYAYTNQSWKDKYGTHTWKEAAQNAVIKMNEDLNKFMSAGNL